MADQFDPQKNLEQLKDLMDRFGGGKVVHAPAGAPPVMARMSQQLNRVVSQLQQSPRAAAGLGQKQGVAVSTAGAALSSVVQQLSGQSPQQQGGQSPNVLTNLMNRLVAIISTWIQQGSGGGGAGTPASIAQTLAIGGPNYNQFITALGRHTAALQNLAGQTGAQPAGPMVPAPMTSGSSGTGAPRATSRLPAWLNRRLKEGGWTGKERAEFGQELNRRGAMLGEGAMGLWGGMTEDPNRELSAGGSFVKGGTAAVGAALPKKWGEGVAALGSFIDRLMKAGDGLLSFSRNLFDSNMRFAQFSGEMAQVQAEQMGRDIRLTQERGERLAPSANYLAESMSRFERNVAPMQDAVIQIKNVLAGAILETLANTLGVVNDVWKWIQDKNPFPKKQKITERSGGAGPRDARELLNQALGNELDIRGGKRPDWWGK